MDVGAWVFVFVVKLSIGKLIVDFITILKAVRPNLGHLTLLSVTDEMRK